jgi:hypothetical protein
MKIHINIAISITSLYCISLKSAYDHSADVHINSPLLCGEEGEVSFRGIQANRDMKLPKLVPV